MTFYKASNKSKPWLNHGLIVLVTMLLAGCQTFQEQAKPTLVEQELATSIKDNQQAQAKVVTPPEDITKSLLPPMPKLSNVQVEKKFDLAVNNAPAREFFMGLVEGTDFNVVVSPEVSGNISLDLKQVTVTQVMDLVREIYGYEYSFKNNLYQIYSASLKTLMFPVNYLNIKRRGSSTTRVNSGEVSDNYSSGPSNNTGSNFSNQLKQGGGNQSDTTHSTQIETQTNTDFWKELQETLTMLVADNPLAQIVVSPQTNMVIVRALPKELRLISDYLVSIQAVMDRQVLLEAKVLEVILGDSFQAGIDWTSIASVNSGNNVSFTQNGRSVVNPNSSDLAGIFSMVYQGSNFDLMIDLLETQGLVQVLSSPRISTINNQKAVIKVGTDEFFVTDISSTTVAGAGASTTSPDVTLTPFFSGIALDVTPQIDAQGNIVLHVHPSISEVEDQEKVLTLGDDLLTLPLARSTIRESDSIIRAKSGQVVVIGGLMQTQTVDSDSGTPVLNDVPVVGNLFNQKNMNSRKTELVILIRPIIVEDDTWGKYLEQTRGRVGNMLQNNN
jgi:MSHA biogenesis protein MshL